MLFNPKWARPQPPPLSQPSLNGFILFVAFKMLQDPNGEYRWSDSAQCAVAQYLFSIGRWSYDWHKKFSCEPKLWLLDYLACGHMRDRRGRFTDDQEKAVWRWRDLHRRLKKWHAEAV